MTNQEKKEAFNLSNRVQTKTLYKESLKSFKGVLDTNLGTVLKNKVGVNKTYNINRGNYLDQQTALNALDNLEIYLNNYKGKINVRPPHNLGKTERKKSLIGYFTFKTEDGFEICLEADQALEQDWKLYYIKKR
ncbi:hypothetical protein GO491_03205 [Flavobacteriaceae bacterium Ap0902]|nr:hypothetical protein [Flavobacteriaceae bacterium Ap0902]